MSFRSCLSVLLILSIATTIKCQQSSPKALGLAVITAKDETQSPLVGQMIEQRYHALLSTNPDVQLIEEPGEKSGQLLISALNTRGQVLPHEDSSIINSNLTDCKAFVTIANSVSQTPMVKDMVSELPAGSLMNFDLLNWNSDKGFMPFWINHLANQAKGGIGEVFSKRSMMKRKGMKKRRIEKRGLFGNFANGLNNAASGLNNAAKNPLGFMANAGKNIATNMGNMANKVVTKPIDLLDKGAQAAAENMDILMSNGKKQKVSKNTINQMKNIGVVDSCLLTSSELAQQVMTGKLANDLEGMITTVTKAGQTPRINVYETDATMIDAILKSLTSGVGDVLDQAPLPGSTIVIEVLAGVDDEGNHVYGDNPIRVRYTRDASNAAATSVDVVPKSCPDQAKGCTLGELMTSLPAADAQRIDDLCNSDAESASNPSTTGEEICKKRKDTYPTTETSSTTASPEITSPQVQETEHKLPEEGNGENEGQNEGETGGNGNPEKPEGEGQESSGSGEEPSKGSGGEGEVPTKEETSGNENEVKPEEPNVSKEGEKPNESGEEPAKEGNGGQEESSGPEHEVNNGNSEGEKPNESGEEPSKEGNGGQEESSGPEHEVNNGNSEGEKPNESGEEPAKEGNGGQEESSGPEHEVKPSEGEGEETNDHVHQIKPSEEGDSNDHVHEIKHPEGEEEESNDHVHQIPNGNSEGEKPNEGQVEESSGGGSSKGPSIASLFPNVVIQEIPNKDGKALVIPMIPDAVVNVDPNNLASVVKPNDKVFVRYWPVPVNVYNFVPPHFYPIVPGTLIQLQNSKGLPAIQYKPQQTEK